MSHHPDGWYVVADARRLRRRPVKLRRFGMDLVAWRDEHGTARCLPAACPHRGADLSRGRVRAGLLECPYHGFRFDGSGRCVLAPCEGDRTVPPGLRTDALPVCEAEGLIWLWRGASVPAPMPPWFPPLSGDASVATVAGTFDCHLSRFVENALDVHHFAFVHRAILPFVGSRVTMTEATLEGDLIRASGTIEPGRGERRRRTADFSFEVLFPGIVRVTTLGVDLVAAACPIEEGATWVAARYYRPRIGPRPLARAMSWLGAQTDWHTAQRQDRRILRGVRPVVGSPRTNVAVGADRAISLWYRRWAESQRAGSAVVSVASRDLSGHPWSP